LFRLWAFGSALHSLLTFWITPAWRSASEAVRGGSVVDSYHPTTVPTALPGSPPFLPLPRSGRWRRVGALRSGRRRSYRRPPQPSPCAAPPDEDVLQQSWTVRSAATELGLLPRTYQDRQRCAFGPPSISLTQLEFELWG
jgi:hypothetical protein